MKIFTKIKLTNLAIVIAITLLTSCGAHNKLSSPSRPYYQDARSLFRDNKEIEAIYLATQGVIADRAYNNSKEFLYENFDNTMQKIHAELKQYENTKDTAGAVRRLHIHSTLVDIYSNISKMDMPLKHHKNKWQWETKFIDYSKEKQESRDYAYTVFYDFAVQKLHVSETREDVTNANSIFATGHNRYTDAGKEKRQESLKNFQNELFTFGDKNKNANTWQGVIPAAQAFFHAKALLNDTSRANNGFDYTSKRVSKLQTEDGKVHTKKGDIPSLLQAEKLYGWAVEWNKDNTEAAKLKEDIKPIIAEAYYKEAVASERQPNVNLAEVKLMYENAQKWVPNYKDTEARIYSLTIRQEIIVFQNNVASTQKEYNATQGNINTVNKAANSADDVMGKITYISNTLRKMDKTMGTTCAALKPISLIPVIGVVAAGLDKAIYMARVPVGKSVSTFNTAEKPFITPAKNATEKMKNITNSTSDKMKSINNAMTSGQKTARDLENNIHKVKDIEALKAIEAALKEVNKSLNVAENQFKGFNKTTNEVVKASNMIIEVSKTVAPVEGGLKAIEPALKHVGKVTHEIDKVLSQKVFGFSVKDALSKADYIANAAMKLLEPAMKGLGIEIPQIPGIAELEATIAGFKPRFEAVDKARAELEGELKAFTNIENSLTKNLKVIQSHIN
jgi:uncharacterized protein YoxC